jgi:hypothetical protein
MYFKKINLQIPHLNYEDFIDSHLVSYGKNKLLSYYRLKPEGKNAVLNALPAELMHKVEVLYCHSGQIEPNVVPHIDNGISVSINCYIETANATTIFFEKKESTIAKPTPGIDSSSVKHTNGFIFDVKDLNFASSFKADAGDSYILDVSKIHAVKGLDLPSIRKFICIQTSKFTFDQFVELFSD